MEASHKNFQVIVKNVHTFDGKNAADFIEWYEKILISLNIYNKAAFRILQGAPVPSAATYIDGSKLAAWNTVNKDLYNVLFFTTKGAACSVARRFAGKTLDEGLGHGQRAWAALRETFGGCSKKALRAEHAKKNSTRMNPGQDPDEFLYELDTRRERLNACDPPEGPTDRQFEDIILQALPPEYGRISTSHLEKLDFGIAVIRRMTSTIYTRPTLPVRARRRGLRGARLPCPRQKTTVETSFATTANAWAISRTRVPSAPSTSISDNNESNGMNSKTSSRADGINKAGSVAVKHHASRQTTEGGGLRTTTLLTTAMPTAAP